MTLPTSIHQNLLYPTQTHSHSTRTIYQTNRSESPYSTTIRLLPTPPNIPQRQRSFRIPHRTTLQRHSAQPFLSSPTLHKVPNSSWPPSLKIDYITSKPPAAIRPNVSRNRPEIRYRTIIKHPPAYRKHQTPALPHTSRAHVSIGSHVTFPLQPSLLYSPTSIHSLHYPVYTTPQRSKN